MDQFNPEALNYPFGGLNFIFFVVIFHSLIQLFKKMLFMINQGMPYGMINRVVNLTMTTVDF
jgi:hypothetical protein